MGYSELIKNFDRIREYMRQFYVYGFKSRTEYDSKSARSYDNERRRMESWLGSFMRFRKKADGKNVFLSVDSRSIPANPLYNAFKAKSFTSGDVVFHFYVLDLLCGGKAYTAQQITDLLSDRYFCHFASDRQPDISSVRKKLKEYVALGLLKQEKRGKEQLFLRNECAVPLEAWDDTLAFFSEADPLGVIGSFLLDKLPAKPDHFRYKHHYVLHALDSQVLLQLLTAIGEQRAVHLTNASVRTPGAESCHEVLPLHIFISTQGGRQYLLCYHYAFHKMMFFRLDYIRAVHPEEPEPEYGHYKARCLQFRARLWGASGGAGFQREQLEMTVRFSENEDYIYRRLEREKRNGTVQLLEPGLCRFRTEVYDAMELLPWIRTFTGRIVKLECSNRAVTEQFYTDLIQTASLYGGDT